MKPFIAFTILLMSITACAPATPAYLPIPPAAMPSITSTMPPAATDTPTMLPTLTPLLTSTPLPSVTVLPTPTPIFPYVFPIEPARSARFKPGGHAYPATDIFAPEGQKVVAVTDGVVNYISYVDLWDPVNDNPDQRGGIAVAILGDDGFIYYGSHLESVADGIAFGVHVTAGQLLGYVGNTGDARDTDPHLHFGISRSGPTSSWQTRRGEIDPYPCLTMWLQGFRCTPQP
jgi:peptidoglycan LD-endopeptidase LytH